MLGIMLRKLVTKKWMFGCLLLGCTLLIATVVSFPLYRNAAFDRMLRDEFADELAQTGKWPARIEMTGASPRNTDSQNIYMMESVMNGIESSLRLTTKENISFYKLNTYQMNSLLSREDIRANLRLRVACMSDLPEHVKLLGGEMYSDTGLAEDGVVEAVISQTCMTTYGLLLGESFQFNSVHDPDNNKLKVRIVGVIDSVEGDPYWDIGVFNLTTEIMINEKLFRDYFVERGTDSDVTCKYCYLFEYESMTSDDVDFLMDALAKDPDTYKDSSFGGVIEKFYAKKERISTTLFILQVPVMILLGAFLFMISSQMYDMEKNEISVIKSRGSSGMQIFRLYIYQSVFLTAVGALLGVPLGVFFSKILGSASNFLEFKLARKLEVRFTLSVWLWLAGAAAVTVLILAVPAIRHSRVSIVNLKQKKAAKKSSLWEKCFLDVICLGVAMYGYYNYSRSREQFLQDVLQGKPLDPLLYLCSSLFIVGLGLLYLRVQPLLVKLIYLIGQKWWHPASYASFMENLKNGRKQQFIMLFLILTISLGIFHATVACTILENAMKNTEYLDGVDIIVKEAWKMNQFVGDDEDASSFRSKYIEPDAGKYSTIDFAESYTKVLAVGDSYGTNTGKATLREGSSFNPAGEVSINFMAIHTKDFGEITWVDRELLEKHYYTYLNELAAQPNGVLISRNLQEQLGLEEGSRVTITYINSSGAALTFDGRVLDFVDYWPGYAPTVTQMNQGGNTLETSRNYLAVANFDAVQREFGETQPYEMWISLKESAREDDMARWINENELSVRKYKNRAEDLQANIENPLLQGTNGVLTMGFLVMILLCGVGYLIYWIMSIRSREMMFGVLRAFGMHKKELLHMLLIEQFFSGILTILTGIGIGKLVSDLFVPMLQTAYAVSDQVLPLKIYVNLSDMMRLYGALAVMIIVCLAVLAVLVVKLNVTKALKLGEE